MILAVFLLYMSVPKSDSAFFLYCAASGNSLPYASVFHYKSEPVALLFVNVFLFSSFSMNLIFSSHNHHFLNSSSTLAIPSTSCIYFSYDHNESACTNQDIAKRRFRWLISCSTEILQDYILSKLPFYSLQGFL